MTRRRLRPACPARPRQREQPTGPCGLSGRWCRTRRRAGRSRRHGPVMTGAATGVQTAPISGSARAPAHSRLGSWCGRTRRPACRGRRSASATSPHPDTPPDRPRQQRRARPAGQHRPADRLDLAHRAPHEHARRNEPNVDGARISSNSLLMPPCRITSRSSKLSAPAAIQP